MKPIIEAWIIIEKLGALCATPGVSQAVQNAANEQIVKLLNDVVAPELTKLSATSSGLIVK